MAFSKVFTGSIEGIEAKEVEVETNLDSHGFPGFTLVGLPGKEVDEARERVRSAIKNSGFKFPDKKIVVNLAPADLHKRGSLFDLPISIGILSVSNAVKNENLKSVYMLGELSLNGELSSVKGIFSLVLDAVKTFDKVIVPHNSYHEVKDINPNKIYGFLNLKDVVNFLNEGLYSPPVIIKKNNKNSRVIFESLFSKIEGQDFAKRAIEITVAGGHNLALYGSPGAGKSLLAKSIYELLPPLSQSELFEVCKIYSVVENLFSIKNITRPFRNPHHSISKSGMIGGGNPVLPGEISLAHNGILFLDEFTEFSKDVIESLRSPLEDRSINLVRGNRSYYLPSNFTLVVAFNPCPCGNYGNPNKKCICAEHQIKKYFSKLSGPILDRIDLFVNCRAIDTSSLLESKMENKNLVEKIKNKIKKAQSIQNERYKQDKKIILNRDLSLTSINKYINLSTEVKDVLDAYANKLSISARSYHRLVKISRTIADLEGEENIQKNHILEAIQYRFKFN